MNNVLACVLFVNFYGIANDSSLHVKFAYLGKPLAMQINSEGLSNSHDGFLSLPKSYKALLSKDSCDFNIKGVCGERIITTKKTYSIFGFPLHYYHIRIEHRHDFWGPILTVGGKRTLLLNNIPVKTYLGQSRKILGPKYFTFDIPQDRIAGDGSLFLMNSDEYPLAAYSTPEFKTTLGEKYQISFKYLLPFRDDCSFDIHRYIDTETSWRVLDKIENKLKGDNKNYYKQFKKTFKIKESTSMRLNFTLTRDDNFIRECFIRDLKVTRLGNTDEP